MFHILVVEDDQALNKLICRVLEKNGYEATAVFDGEEALAMLDKTYIDLIITDLMMPHMDRQTYRAAGEYHDPEKCQYNPEPDRIKMFFHFSIIPL